MKTTVKMKSFIKQFIAKVEGDDATAIAERTLREADSALTVAIAVKTGQIVSLEDAIERAKEKLASARVNGGERITNGTHYVSNLVTAKNDIRDAEEELEEAKEVIAFWKEELANLSK